MSIGFNIQGFRPPDAKWREMRAVWDACKRAGILPPEEVYAFFRHDEPDERGIEMPRKELEACGAVREWKEDMREGYEVELSKLPPGLTHLRFYVSF